MTQHRAASRLALGLFAILVFGGCGRDEHDKPLNIFGRTGAGPGEFSYPRAAVISSDRRLYVVDKTGRIQCFEQNGEFVRAWRMPEIDAGKPTGLAASADGLIIAADTHYGRIMAFDLNGAHRFTIGAFGKADGQFMLPTDVAVDAAGNIYVSEYGGNDRVNKFSAQHDFLLSFGGPDSGTARLNRPQSVLIDPDQSIWVADASNHRICHFSAVGELLGTFGHIGSARGELNFPYGIDRLSDGTFVVCEYGNNRLQRFDRDGKSLGIWGEAGRKPGQLAYPWAAVVGDSDRVFVVDSGNNRVQVIDGRASRTWH